MPAPRKTTTAKPKTAAKPKAAASTKRASAKAEPKKAAPKAAPRTRTEEIRVAADQVKAKVQQLVKEGNVRRIKVKKGTKTIVEIPVTIAAVGVLLAPYLAAFGAIAALVTDCTLEIERDK